MFRPRRLLLASAILAGALFASAPAASAPAASTPDASTGTAVAAPAAADRGISLQGRPEITLYNRDLALVRQSVALTLSKGETEVEVSGLPPRIDSTSVRLGGSGFRVGVQAFRFNVWNADRVFRQFLGDSIAYRYGGRRYRGLLAGIDGDDLFIQRSDSFQVLTMLKRSQVSEIEFPGGRALQTRPTVQWRIDSDQGGKRDAELSYLTAGLAWTADYRAAIDASERSVELTGWATIVNRSGASYDRARVTLVAGELQRDGESPEPGPSTEGSPSPSAAAPELFAYRAYPLERDLTLENLATIQVPIVGPARVAARRTYRYDGARDGSKVRVELELENQKRSGLGIPLPEGKLRVYGATPRGGSALIGEDRIPHTAAGERLRVRSGIAFDLVGERTRVSHTRVSRNVTEDAYRIRIRNHGAKPVTVAVAEALYGNWEITQRSVEPRKKDASSAEFDVEVPAGGESVLTYTVRYTF